MLNFLRDDWRQTLTDLRALWGYTFRDHHANETHEQWADRQW